MSIFNYMLKITINMIIFKLAISFIEFSTCRPIRDSHVLLNPKQKLRIKLRSRLLSQININNILLIISFVIVIGLVKYNFNFLADIMQGLAILFVIIGIIMMAHYSPSRKKKANEDDDKYTKKFSIIGLGTTIMLLGISMSIALLY